MDRSLVERVAQVPGSPVSGTYYRHASIGREPFNGGLDGRWGAPFPVIYLADNEAGAITEAYRHLVEYDGVPAARVQPRDLYTVAVQAFDLLDLLDPAHLAAVGLTDADLRSPVGDYETCQEVAAAAHQLGRHGIVAPAAHGIGNTLALFRERINPSEQPRTTARSRWEHLPPDPRQAGPLLRAVRP